MNTKIKRILFTFLLLTFSVNVKASSISISGTSLNVGETKTLTISVSSGLMSADGDVTSNDPSCIQITSGSYFTRTSMDSTAISSAGSVTIKALKAGCSTTLKISNASTNTLDGEEERGLSFTSGTITVKEPEPTPAPSTDSNSSSTTSNSSSTSGSTSSSSGGSSSSTGGTSSSNNTSTSSSSSTSSSDAATSAAGIVKKSGSSNNSLTSLSVTGYSLDKKFNTNTTSYSISVGADVKSINVNAKASDSKAKVTIYGTNSLKSGKNTVSVVVVAENGDKKTYTITVNKEKNPNATEEEEEVVEEVQEETIELSNDNNLLDIKPSIGILSPVFDQEKTKYVIYLPFEVEEITFDAMLSSDSATLDVTDIGKLEVGDNKVTFTVTAEDGSTKKYVVIVKRAINPEFMDLKNIFLKSINITGGKLTKKFDKNIFEYYYKGKDLKIDAIPEDENSTVEIRKQGDIYYVKVEAPNGDFSIYTLKPYKISNTTSFKVVLLIGGFVVGYITKSLLKRYFIKKKNSKKVKVK